jgi:asparagine synthase (glutamine-hydrolysing)
LLDADLVAFGLALHPWEKIGLSQKRILRKTMASRLPDQILHRPKRGFGVPLDRWFRADLRSYVQGTLGARGARVRAHLEPAALDALLAEHNAGAADYGHTLWTLLTLELFLRKEKW